MEYSTPFRIRQTFDRTEVADIPRAVREELSAHKTADLIRNGDRVAVGVGSRGIFRIDCIVKTVVDVLLEQGAQPFIVPAMGSHGSASSDGQKAVLASYGISERTMGVPVDASMDTELIGHTESGIPVHMAKSALDADRIVPVNRIKAHTDFTGKIESGLIKMLAIGFGKETGCTALHKCGTSDFARIIPEAGQFILDTGKVAFGLAIIENGYDHTALIRAIPANEMMKEEAALLLKAKALMPKIPFREIDVLIVDQFGKEISGAGMDPNITGRRSTGRIDPFDGPSIQQIVVNHLTSASHGNAIAINAADFITSDFFQQIDLDATYKNSLACCNPVSAQIPVIAADEEEAVSWAVACCRGIDESAPRIVKIKDTLSLAEMEISEALLREAEENPALQIIR